MQITRRKPPEPVYVPGTSRGEEMVLEKGKEPGRGGRKSYRGARDATGIHPQLRASSLMNAEVMSALARLRRFTRQPNPLERCELCGAGLFAFAIRAAGDSQLKRVGGSS